MRPRPYSTEKYLNNVSRALRKPRPTKPNPVLDIAVAASGWCAFLSAIFWLVSVLPKPDPQERMVIDHANPQIGAVWYHDHHFWFWAVPLGKTAPEWVDP